MNINEFLADRSLQFPVNRDASDFEAFASGLLDYYIKKLSELTQPSNIAEELKNHISEIEKFCGNAKEVVRASLRGLPHDAYEHFCKAMEPMKGFLAKLELSDLSADTFPTLYRVRKGTNRSFSRNDLFHISFEERHLVATQRYSVPGLPCLYLGGSLYTCWVEMGRLPMHELHAAAFWLKEGATIKLLNLTRRPAMVRRFELDPEGNNRNGKESESRIVNHILTWPLTLQRGCELRCSIYSPGDLRLRPMWNTRNIPGPGITGPISTR